MVGTLKSLFSCVVFLMSHEWDSGPGADPAGLLPVWPVPRHMGKRANSRGFGSSWVLVC